LIQSNDTPAGTLRGHIVVLEPDGRSQRHAKSERRCARACAAPHDERDALNDSLHALLGIQLTSSWQSGKTYTTDPGGGAPTLNVKEMLSQLARFEHLMGMAASSTCAGA